MKLHGVRCWIGAGLLLFASCGGEVPKSTAGRVRSPASDAVLERIAFGSCAFQWAEQHIWGAVVARRPDLYLSLGDAIYGDFDGKHTYDVTAESLRSEWNKLASRPEWSKLIAQVPVYATWDNHDYGHHSAGAEFPLKEESKSIFLDFFGEPGDSERRARNGIYTAYLHGPEGRRVQVILLDTRTFKSPPRLADRSNEASGSLGKYAPNSAPDATLLGEAQWSWLRTQLERPADVRLIASSGQVVADEKGMDEWGNYPRDRKRLFDVVAETGASGVLLLSGNVHFAEVSATDAGPYRLIDFTSSGLTHVNDTYPKAPNRYRVAGPAAALNFGLVEIEWEAKGGPRIQLSAVGADGEVLFEYQVALSSLTLGAPKRDGR